MLRLRILTTALFVLSSIGCAAPVDDTRAYEAPIVNGTLGGNPAVVVLQNYRSGGLCTGTLIADRVVLTAKHCVQEAFASGPVNPSDMVVGVGDSTSRVSAVLRVQSITTTPGSYTTDSQGGVGRDLIGVDVAVMILQSGATGVEPLPIMRESHSTLRGQRLTAVGFGQTPSGEVGVKYTAEGWITGVDSQLIYVGTLICQGDSGGPAITQAGEVAGVVSVGSGRCGTGSAAYNAIYPFLDMIDGALMEAGSCLNDGAERCDGADNDCDDLIDETCTPVGGACAADDECVGNTCRETSSGKICTIPCDPRRPDFGCETGSYCAFATGCEGYCVPLEGEASLPAGADCTTDSECSTLFCTDPGDGRRRCLTACEGDTGSCLAGEACAANPGACGGCVDAEILRASRGLGETCTAGAECLSGDCLAEAATRYCTRGCEADAECGDGFHCRARTCPAGTSCDPGNVCIAGPRGDVGDPCLVSGDCADGAFCATQGGRSWCTSVCPSEGCPEGFECVPAGGTEVCAPERGLLGDPCMADADCVTSLCAIPGGSTSGECTRRCSAEVPCSVGFECRRTADGVTAVCIDPGGSLDGGGCSATPGGASSGGGLASILLLGLVAVWRRRRR